MDRGSLNVQDNPGLANWGRLDQNRSIFNGDVADEIEYERVVVNVKQGAITGGPFIRIRPVFEYRTAEGKMKKFGKTGLFTWTSKMSCPSFSLPAGPAESGGTCPASKRRSVEAEGSYQEYHPPLSSMPSGQIYICDTCYAGKGRYLMYKSMSVGQMARLKWVTKQLRNGTFTRKMTEAIASLLDPEIEDLLAAKLVSNKYFRIHDAGDFFSPDYYRAWVEVCHKLPEIRFWAPTRQWVFEKWRAVFDTSPPPQNLALRPSALFTGAPPPMIPGMSAGSGSVDGRMPEPVWNCPAYESDEGSCAGAHCRTCWTGTKKPVNYLTH